MTDKKWNKSQRGFKVSETRIDRHDSEYRLVESSLATEPAVRLYIKDNLAKCDASLHLNIEDAKVLALELLQLCKDHYQNHPNYKPLTDEALEACLNDIRRVHEAFQEDNSNLL